MEGFKVTAEEAIIHPKYKSTTWRAYDICLIRTKSGKKKLARKND